MPVTVSFPGVYIEEIPSGVRTIVGVPTSITAFIGRALRGPTEEPVAVFGFGDFEREFGGLQVDDPMGYAVRDFFLNGGGQAIIVRLFRAPFASEQDRQKAETAALAVADAATGTDAAAALAAARTKAAEFPNSPEKEAAAFVVAAAQSAAGVPGATAQTVQAAARAAALAAAPHSRAKLALGRIPLEAASPGTWGANLRGTIDRNVSEEVARSLGLTRDDLFNLKVRDDSPGGASEEFFNLTVKESIRRADRVLEADSRLVRWGGRLDPTNPPPIAAASDPVTTAEEELRRLPPDADPQTVARGAGEGGESQGGGRRRGLGRPAADARGLPAAER